MNDKPSGLFSLSIQSIEWQVKNLFQEAGGDKAVELMDRLSGIPESEREILLDRFLSAVSKVVCAQINAGSHLDGSVAISNQSSKLEDQIVKDVLAQLEGPKRFEVLDGGKAEKREAGRLIDFAAAKKSRGNRTDSTNVQGERRGPALYQP